MKMGMLRTISPQHKLLVLLRRSVRGLYELDFVSHAARMMRRNADEEEEERGVVGFFFDAGSMFRYLEA